MEHEGMSTSRPIGVSESRLKSGRLRKTKTAFELLEEIKREKEQNQKEKNSRRVHLNF